MIALSMKGTSSLGPRTRVPPPALASRYLAPHDERAQARDARRDRRIDRAPLDGTGPDADRDQRP